MKQVNIFLVLSMIIFLGSCNLDTVPESAITDEGFFSNDEEILAGVINIYDGIQGGNILENTDNPSDGIQVEYLMAEMLSDNTRTRSGSSIGFDFEIFNVNPQNAGVLSYYRAMYNTIFRANLV